MDQVAKTMQLDIPQAFSSIEMPFAIINAEPS
jgi:hypothetical protein